MVGEVVEGDMEGTEMGEDMVGEEDDMVEEAAEEDMEETGTVEV